MGFMLFEEEEEKEEDSKIIKRKNIESKPMSEEEAILQMELLGHDFFVFKNVDEECVSVLYKRKDGTYGGKEYFYKDRSNDAFGGLEVGDIAFAYIKRINRCLPFMITRVDISKEELDDAGISRADLTCLRYTLDEDNLEEE